MTRSDIWKALQAAHDMPRGKRWLPELAEDRKAIRRIQNSPALIDAIVDALSVKEETLNG